MDNIRIGDRLKMNTAYLGVGIGDTVYPNGTSIYSANYIWVSTKRHTNHVEDMALVPRSSVSPYPEIVTTPAEQAVYDRIERVLDGYAELTGFNLIERRDDITLPPLAALLEAEFGGEDEDANDYYRDVHGFH